MQTADDSVGLAGKVAIVTGAASGIGEAIATDLAINGVQVVLADVDRAAGDSVAARLAGARFVAANIGDRRDCYDLVTRTVDLLGRIDILVNNAGMQKVARIEEFDDADWDRMLAVMLTGAFTLIKAAIPHMYATGSGRIVNIASALGLRGAPFKPAYTAAKHGLVGLTRSVALESTSRGVTCNAVCPGWVRTPLVDRQLADQSRVKNIPVDQVQAGLLEPGVPRMLEPSEVAAVVTFLCSERASAISGAAIGTDLGWSAQ